MLAAFGKARGDVKALPKAPALLAVEEQAAAIPVRQDPCVRQGSLGFEALTAEERGRAVLTSCPRARPVSPGPKRLARSERPRGLRPALAVQPLNRQGLNS